jgi:hypothetical protein
MVFGDGGRLKHAELFRKASRKVESSTNQFSKGECSRDFSPWKPDPKFLEKIFLVLPWALYSNINTSPSRYGEYAKGFNRASVD